MLTLAAGTGQTIRVSRWAGERTWRDRLVLVLRVAYLFEPGGFFLVTCAIFFPQYVPLSAGIHMWTVGAIGIITLAVMTRASLGHTGQPLSAGGLTQAVYALMPAQLCFVLLLLSPPSVGRFAARAAATSWSAAFWLFAIGYGPLLSRPGPSLTDVTFAFSLI